MTSSDWCSFQNYMQTMSNSLTTAQKYEFILENKKLNDFTHNELKWLDTASDYITTFCNL